MDHERFRDWFSHVDDLTAAQREEVAEALSGRPQGAASLATIELGVDEERRCAHCGSGGSVSRGKARGLRRYRCKACGKTFGALTGTALSGVSLSYKIKDLDRPTRPNRGIDSKGECSPLSNPIPSRKLANGNRRARCGASIHSAESWTARK